MSTLSCEMDLNSLREQAVLNWREARIVYTVRFLKNPSTRPRHNGLDMLQWLCGWK